MVNLLHALVDLPPLAALLLKVTALLGAGWSAHGLLRRADPRWRVLLWRGVLAGLVLLPLLASLASLPVAIAPLPPAPSRPAISFSPSASDFTGLVSEAARSEPAPSAFTFSTAHPSPHIVPPAPPAFSIADWSLVHWLALAGVLWGLGAALLAARLLWSFLRLGRILKNSQPAPARLQALLARVAADLGVAAPVTLRVSPALASPLLCGLRRPVIGLPERLARTADEEELTAILAHELAHLRGRDLAWLLAARAAALACWPHPLAWRLQSAHAAACEAVSDAVAAAYLKDTVAYVGALARVALAVAGRPVALGGLPMARSSQVAWRLALLKRKVYASPLARRRVALALLAGSALLLAFGGIRLVNAETSSAAAATTVTAVHAPTPATITTAHVETSAPVPAGMRVVHFPKDRSLGLLSIQDASLKREIQTFYYWINGTENWETLSQAQGDVVVPAGKRLRLDVLEAEKKDLSPLKTLKPDDLHTLLISGITDKGLACLAGLKGLKELDLRKRSFPQPTDPGPVSNDSLVYLKGLESLEYLSAPPEITDQGLSHLVKIKSLKGLYLKQNKLTNAGLAQLAELPGLEELELSGKSITDDGLVHLARLPHLQYLIMGGITDAGLAHLVRVPSLKILHLGHESITDAGLANIGKIKSLERLDLYKTRVTDAGLPHLANLKSLKMLDLSFTPVSGAGIQTLKNIKSLESLDLPDDILNDQCLAALAELPNLRHLRLPNSSGARPADEKIYYTDQGLTLLCSHLLRLEELNIGGAGLTDEGMKAVAQLGNLRELSIFGGPHITNAGLARLAAVKSLEKLYLFDLDISTTGVNQLNTLTNLRELEVFLGIHDEKFCDATLDLSGLTRLEKIISFPAVRDEDLASLANLTQLQWFQSESIKNTGRLSDAGMVHLARLTNLDRLCLSSPNLTDRGLTYLAGMKKMDCLSLTGNFTDEGLRKLERLDALLTLTVRSGKSLSPAAVQRLHDSLPRMASFAVEGDRVFPSPAGASSSAKLTTDTAQTVQTAQATQAANAASSRHPQPGTPAPPFTVTTLDGKKFTLAEQRGKVVLLHFWATWCSPCVASAPQLEQLHKSLKAKYGERLVCLDLSLDDSKERVAGHVRKFGLTTPQACIGRMSRIGADYGVEGVPDDFMIGPDGKILLIRESPDTDTDTAIAKALESAGESQK